MTQATEGSHSEHGNDQFVAGFVELLPIALAASFRILGDLGRSEEIAQETMVRCFVRWKHVQEYAAPWISRVATNLAIDEWRRDRRSSVLQRGVEIDDCADGLVEQSELRRALGTLSTRQRQAVGLRYIVGYSPDETAHAMGINRAGVLKHTTRALRSLRHQLVEKPAAGRRAHEIALPPGRGRSTSIDLHLGDVRTSDATDGDG